MEWFWLGWQYLISYGITSMIKKFEKSASFTQRCYMRKAIATWAKYCCKMFFCRLITMLVIVLLNARADAMSDIRESL